MSDNCQNFGHQTNEKSSKLKVYQQHFEKLIVANRRNRVIYDLATASVNYDHAETKDDEPIYLGVEALGWLWL